MKCRFRRGRAHCSQGLRRINPTRPFLGIQHFSRSIMAGTPHFIKNVGVPVVNAGDMRGGGEDALPGCAVSALSPAARGSAPVPAR